MVVFISYTQISELAWHAFLLHRAVESKAMTAWALMCINKLACTLLMQSSNDSDLLSSRS